MTGRLTFNSQLCGKCAPEALFDHPLSQGHGRFVGPDVNFIGQFKRDFFGFLGLNDTAVFGEYPFFPGEEFLHRDMVVEVSGKEERNL